MKEVRVDESIRAYEATKRAVLLTHFVPADTICCRDPQKLARKLTVHLTCPVCGRRLIKEEVDVERARAHLYRER